MTINEFFGFRGIRFDVFAVNDEFLFCVVMQVSKKNFHVKRAGYYQGTADVSDLPAGHIEGAAKGMEYDILKKQYIIFICSCIRLPADVTKQTKNCIV